MAILDPTVAQRKFDDEIAKYRALESHHLQRGCFLVGAAYPKATVLFCASRLSPPCILFCAEFDFQDFDMRAPSVVMVDPFTQSSCGWPPLFRRKEIPVPEGSPPAWVLEPMVMQNHPEEPPFLCLPGIREYHANPAHTGDSWLLHRKSGAGTLNFLVEQLHKYGVQPLAGYQIQIVLGEPPS